MAAAPKTATLWLDRVRSDIGHLGVSKRMLDRLSWDATRFGITPSGVAARVRRADGPSLISISLPKAGTHLVERALCLHPKVYRRFVPTLYPYNLAEWGGLDELLSSQRSHELIVGHLPFDAGHAELIDLNGTKAFFVIRDPRDILVSNVFYISGYRAHNWHDVVTAEPDVKARLRLLIEGRTEAPRIPGIGEYLDSYAGWLGTNAAVIRYEDLVGERADRLGALARIYAHAGLALGEDDLGERADRLISSASPTFRRGATGQGREHFDTELERLFEEAAGPHLERYGYA